MKKILQLHPLAHLIFLLSLTCKSPYNKMYILLWDYYLSDCKLDISYASFYFTVTELVVKKLDLVLIQKSLLYHLSAIQQDMDETDL